METIEIWLMETLFTEFRDDVALILEAHFDDAHLMSVKNEDVTRRIMEALREQFNLKATTKKIRNLIE